MFGNLDGLLREGGWEGEGFVIVRYCVEDLIWI